MSVAIRAGVWLSTAFALLYSLQYYLAIIYQLEGVPTSTVHLSSLQQQRNRSAFSLLPLAERPANSLGVLLLISGGTVDGTEPDYATAKDSVGKQFEAYVLEAASRYYRPTVEAIKQQAGEISNTVQRLRHQHSQQRFVLMTMDSASESMLRFLAGAESEVLSLIRSVLFINPGGNNVKEHHYEDLLFKQQTRKLLTAATERLKNISFVSLSTMRHLQIEGRNDVFSMERCQLPNLSVVDSMELWGLHLRFPSAHAMIANQHFCKIVQKFTCYSLQKARSNTELQYYLKYGEQLNPTMNSPEEQWLRRTVFLFECPLPTTIVFRRGQESARTVAPCVQIRIRTGASGPPYSLLIRSRSHIDVLTAELRVLSPYYQNGSFWLYFVESVRNITKFYVLNRPRGEITVSLTQVLRFPNELSISNNNITRLPLIVALPQKPLRVCATQQLDLPYIERDGCLDVEGALLFRWRDTQLTLHPNPREVYGRLFRRFEHMHLSLVFANMLAMIMLEYEYALVMCMNIAILLVYSGDATKLLSILLYSLFVFSLSTLAISMLDKVVQIRKKIECPPMLEAFIYVLPLVLGISRLAHFDLCDGLEWVALLSAYFLALNCRGQFIGIYLLYMSWDYVLMAQFNYHFCLLLLWLYGMVTSRPPEYASREQRSELEIFQQDKLRFMTTVHYFLLLYFSTDRPCVNHLLAELYAAQLLILKAWFVWKRERIIRALQGELQNDQ